MEKTFFLGIFLQALLYFEPSNLLSLRKIVQLLNIISLSIHSFFILQTSYIMFLLFGLLGRPKILCNCISLYSEHSEFLKISQSELVLKVLLSSHYIKTP